MKLSDLRAGIKYRTAQGDFIAEAPYDKFRKLENGGYIAELDLKTEAGTFLFRDRVAEGEEGLFVQVNCTAEKLGAGTMGIGLHCGAAVGAPYEELSFFAPSAWYGKNELFEGKSNKYPPRRRMRGRRRRRSRRARLRRVRRGRKNGVGDRGSRSRIRGGAAVLGGSLRRRAQHAPRHRRAQEGGD